MMTAITPSNDEASKMGVTADGGEAEVETDVVGDGSLDQLDFLEPDTVADIEALEQSLTALLDEFRSGRMNASNCRFSDPMLLNQSKISYIGLLIFMITSSCSERTEIRTNEKGSSRDGGAYRVSCEIISNAGIASTFSWVCINFYKTFTILILEAKFLISAEFLIRTKISFLLCLCPSEKFFFSNSDTKKIIANQIM